MKILRLIPLCALIVASSAFASHEYTCLISTPKSIQNDPTYLFQTFNLVVNGFHAKVRSVETGEIVRAYLETQESELPDGRHETIGIVFQAKVGPKDLVWMVSESPSRTFTLGLPGAAGQYYLSCTKQIAGRN